MTVPGSGAAGRRGRRGRTPAPTAVTLRASTDICARRPPLPNGPVSRACDGWRASCKYCRALLRKQVAEAERLAADAFDVGSGSGQPDALPIFVGGPIEIRRHQHRLAELEPMVAQAVDHNAALAVPSEPGAFTKKAASSSPDAAARTSVCPLTVFVEALRHFVDHARPESFKSGCVGKKQAPSCSAMRPGRWICRSGSTPRRGRRSWAGSSAGSKGPSCPARLSSHTWRLNRPGSVAPSWGWRTRRTSVTRSSARLPPENVSAACWIWLARAKADPADPAASVFAKPS